ncbi:MAG TPA: glycosyltransferase [Nitrososphaera sp.]|jgi:UDP-N-acetylglucosamine--N-acetylmuramyl-(pentapeptide) pyrophosphoryl-undecaprenol N-acetylglucosamine transferase|nr:glycosyltransferase [Nitrososphaera sp.]
MINFFTSSIGLGHATRDIAIAEKLSKDGIQFVSGDKAADLLAKKGFKTHDVYRPEKFKVDSGQLRQSFKWLMDYYLYYKKCKVIAKEFLEKHDGLIISDEDFASIAIGEEMRRKRVLVTDITETHFTSGAASIIEKQMNKSMKKMIEACDCVIIPDVGKDSGNVVHVGPIVRHTHADRKSLRNSFGFSRNTIVLSIGGTDAGRFLIEKTIEAYNKGGSRLDADLVIVSGPSLKLSDSPSYRNLGFVENLHELIYAADLVVSLAGRSTMDESIAYGTPGIFIPIKGHFEQEEGAARLGFKYEDVSRLQLLIEEGLHHGRSNVTNTTGAEKAAKIIESL